MSAAPDDRPDAAPAPGGPREGDTGRTPPREVVVVTGVGGMALACARRLGTGRHVVLAARHAGRLHAAAEALRAEGLEVHEVTTDVAVAPQVQALAAAAAALGPVRTVVHTAGVSPLQADAAGVVAVDLVGTALVLDAFVAYAGVGTVVVCTASSAAGLLPVPPEVEHALATTPTAQLADLPVLATLDAGHLYALAKRGNRLRVEALAAAYGRRGARVVSVSPGVVGTRMGTAELAGPSGAHMRAMVGASATARVGTCDEIAAVVEFVASPAASFVTGCDLLVDGGQSAAARALAVEASAARV